jgi:NADP-dependent 3-hydroxy acid dehydrogenase YdfG
MILKDKVVVITGGSKGLGLGLAKEFQKQGAKVIVSARDEELLKQVAEENNFDYFVCDVTNEQKVHELSNYVISKYSGYDVWVNNAGIMTKTVDFFQQDINDVKKMFEVNFFGYWYGARCALEYFISKNSGLLMNINSSSALEGKKEIIGYSASKYALKGLTDGLEKYLDGKNIQQINVYPGGIKTDLHKENNSANYDKYFIVDYVTKIIMDNLLKDAPEKELKILRSK